MICAYDNCNNEFEAKTHNQKYCSDECCKIATNIKIKEKYYNGKARRAGVAFKCNNKGCNSTLSRYSTENICESCKSKERSKERKAILDMLNEIS